MNLRRSLQLIGKYAHCKNCGSEMIGNGAGTLVIEENLFRRTCKCGWEIEVKDGEPNE